LLASLGELACILAALIALPAWLMRQSSPGAEKGRTPEHSFELARVRPRSREAPVREHATGIDGAPRPDSGDPLR